MPIRLTLQPGLQRAVYHHAAIASQRDGGRVQRAVNEGARLAADTDTKVSIVVLYHVLYSLCAGEMRY